MPAPRPFRAMLWALRERAAQLLRRLEAPVASSTASTPQPYGLLRPSQPGQPRADVTLQRAHTVHHPLGHPWRGWAQTRVSALCGSAELGEKPAYRTPGQWAQSWG